LRLARLLFPMLAVFALVGAPAASAATKRRTSSSPTASVSSGGAGLGAPVTPVTPVSTIVHPVVQGDSATIVHGVAYAPSYAPTAVQRAIWAGNQIRHKPYIYGGGHGTWNDAGYDCSGSVSYVLHAAGLLKQSMDSGEFMSWDASGLGQWITVYTNPGHAFIEIAGIRFDTSSEGDPNPAPGTGPRWRPLLTETQGFVARHPLGL
jgi:hypothetical protein